jgi:hypothetical protein
MMNWKLCGRKPLWPYLTVLSPQLPGVTEKNHENSSQVSRSPEEDFNPGPREYEAGVLTTTFDHYPIV